MDGVYWYTYLTYCICTREPLDSKREYIKNEMEQTNELFIFYWHRKCKYPFRRCPTLNILIGMYMKTNNNPISITTKKKLLFLCNLHIYLCNTAQFTCFVICNIFAALKQICQWLLLAQLLWVKLSHNDIRIQNDKNMSTDESENGAVCHYVYEYVLLNSSVWILDTVKYLLRYKLCYFEA